MTSGLPDDCIVLQKTFNHAASTLIVLAAQKARTPDEQVHKLYVRAMEETQYRQVSGFLPSHHITEVISSSELPYVYANTVTWHKLPQAIKDSPSGLHQNKHFQKWEGVLEVKLPLAVTRPVAIHNACEAEEDRILALQFERSEAGALLRVKYCIERPMTPDEIEGLDESIELKRKITVATRMEYFFANLNTKTGLLEDKVKVEFPSSS